MSYQSICRRYLDQFQQLAIEARSSGASSIELATRPAVDTFIRQALAEVWGAPGPQPRIHHDTRLRHSVGAPDWRIEDRDHLGVYAYIDQKDLNERAQFQLSVPEQAQMRRYLELGAPVVVFDGIEFILLHLDDNGSVSVDRRLSIIEKPLRLDVAWSSQRLNLEVPAFLAGLLSRSARRQWAEDELIEHVAIRARSMSDAISELLVRPLGSGQTILENDVQSQLYELQSLLSSHHDPSLRLEQACADFIAQTLSFGLFYIHAQMRQERPEKVTPELRGREFWHQMASDDAAGRLAPFSALHSILAEALTAENSLSNWYLEIERLLSHADIVGVEAGQTDFHSLFERFLAVFDPQVRFDRGAFYTPASLASWLASAAIGVHSHASWAVVEQVRVLEPCCGTGSILEQIMQLPVWENVEVAFYGLEILPAPFALAHYRISQMQTDRSRPVHLLLTDTLSDALHENSDNYSNDFVRHQNRARSLVGQEIQIVVGNPPSVATSVSSAGRERIDALMEDFRPPESQRSTRQNTLQALNNEAYRFLRWCCDISMQSSAGSVALVLPGAVAAAISLQAARLWLLQAFDEIWILEFDDDLRTGIRSESLFNVQQGRCALVGVRQKVKANSYVSHKQQDGDAVTELARVFHCDIRSFSVKEKIRYLAAGFDSSQFSEVVPRGPRYALSPVEPDASAWTDCWPITDTSSEGGIFRGKCSGLKLAPTALLFHSDGAQLEARTRSISRDQNAPYAEIKQQWFAGQQKPPSESKFSRDVRIALSNVASEDIVGYSYRPFVSGSVVVNAGLFDALAATPGDGLRTRPELLAAFSEGAVGLAIAPNPAAVGESLVRFASFAWSLPDNDLVARGNAMIYCDKMPEERHRGSDWDPTVRRNTGTAIQEVFSHCDSVDLAVLFYVYAVLSSNTYRNAFLGALFRPTDKEAPIRIPIPREEAVRLNLVELGHRLAKLEHPGAVYEIPRGMAVKWLSEADEFELVRWRLDAETETLALLSQGRVEAEIHGCTAAEFELVIAGHNVLQGWLRERKAAYLRRTFRRSDADALLSVVARLKLQFDVIGEIDPLVADMLETRAILRHPRGSGS